MQHVKIGNVPYPVIFNYYTFDAFNKFMNTFKVEKGTYTQSVCVAYCAFITGRYFNGGTFAFDFDDFYALCLTDNSIFKDVANAMGGTCFSRTKVVFDWWKMHSDN